MVSWGINLLAKEHPGFLGEIIGSLEAAPLSSAVNAAMTQQGEAMGQLLAGVDAGPLGKVVNGLIARNPGMVTIS